MTMSERGTPWAEEYRGSGRLTGHVAAEPTRMNIEAVAPGWVWIGDMEEEKFWEMAEAEQISR